MRQVPRLKACACIHRSAVADDVGTSITALPFSSPAQHCEQAANAGPFLPVLLALYLDPLEPS
jgi:hypothetical protein